MKIQQINHEKVAELLTHGTEQLDSQVLSSLRQARAFALQKQRQPVRVFSLGTVGHRAHELMPHSTQQWVAAVILLAAIAFGVTSYWQHAQEHQHSQLDIAILTDDMPIEIFVDQ